MRTPISAASKWALYLAANAISLIVFSACHASQVVAQPTFHPLQNLAYDKKGEDSQGKPHFVRNENIVIANPPTDEKALQTLIESYNHKTLSSEQLSKKFGYIRWFYKESAKMPKDYKESHQGYFDIDRVEDHYDDLLMIVKWKNFGKERSYEFISH